MDNLNTWIHSGTGFSIDTQHRLLGTALVIIILWLIRFAVMRIVLKQTEVNAIRYRWQKTTTYIATVLGMLLVARIWFEGMQSLATYLGLLSAGLAIALKDVVSSMAGWIFILWRRAFTVGDRIQIGEFRGDVIDIRLFKFTLLEIGNWVDADQSTGRIIHVPNSMILTHTLANYTKGFQFIWHEIPVLLTFESDWKKAKGILEEIANRHALHLTADAEKKIKQASRRFMIFYSSLTPAVFTTVRDSGVLLTIRYLISPRKRRISEQGIWEDILTEFAAHRDIDFAYPTQRFYNNITEGKGKTD